MLSPHFDLSGGGYELKLDVALTNFNSSAADVMGSDDEVQLLFTSDGTTWNSLMTWNVNNQPATTGETVTIDLTNITGTNVQFGIWASEGTVDDTEDYDFHFDNFVIQTPPSCPPPTALAVSNVTPTGADFGWTPGGQEQLWDLYIVASGGTAPGASSTPTMNDTGNPSTWSGGAANTTYDAYVRADCGGDNADVSTWVGPVSFTTLCVAYTPDYVEDFTTMTSSNSPNCWTQGEGPITGPTTTGSSGWTSDGFGNNGTTGSARFNIYTTGDEDWLISPSFDLSAGGYEIGFDVALTPFSGTGTATIGTDDEVQLLYSDDGGTTWTNMETWNAGNSPSNTGDVFQQNLSMTGTNVQFGFWVNEGATSGGDINFYIDNFSIRTPPSAPECATVVAPADAASQAPDDGCTDEMILEWIAATTGTAPATYEVYFGTPGSLTLHETVTAPTTTSIVTVTTGTTHAWQVIPIDAGNNAPTGTCPEWTFTATDPNSGSDAVGAGAGGYAFANDIATGTPSVPVYSWIDPVAAGHTEITSWTDDGSSGGDDSYFTIPDVGFAFPFYGTDYQTTNVHIGSNGNIQFGTSGSGNVFNSTIPSTAAANNWIAVLNMDLDEGTSGKVYYGMANGNFVVTWWHYIDYANQANEMTFQAILHNDGNGTIRMQYNDLESTTAGNAAALADALIGIENAAGDDGAVYLDGSGNGGPLLCSPRAIGFSTAASVLPVTLTKFTGTAMTRSNLLTWSTETERNSAYFELQRSNTGSSVFESIGRVNASGNTNLIQEYGFEDKSPSSMSYYRLKMVDLDGSFEYSDVISLLRKQKGFGLYGAYPVPTNSVLTVEYTTEINSDMSIELSDITGRIVLREKFESTTGVQKYDVDMFTLESGTYFVKLSDGQHALMQRVVKQ